MRWRRPRLVRAAAWGVFWVVGLAAMVEWYATVLTLRQPVPLAELVPNWLMPALIGVAMILMLAYWDEPFARGMFAGGAAAQTVSLLLSWTGTLATFVGLVVLIVVWVRVARLREHAPRRRL